MGIRGRGIKATRETKPIRAIKETREEKTATVCVIMEEVKAGTVLAKAKGRDEKTSDGWPPNLLER